MHLQRLKTGEIIAGIAAIVLFISMFCDWYAVEIPNSSGVDFFLNGTGQSAWESLGFVPIFLTIAVVTTLAVVIWRLSSLPYPPPVPINWVIVVLGLISVLSIIFRIVDPPSFGSFQGVFGPTSAERTVQFGIFLALLAAAGVTFGGYQAVREKDASSADLRTGSRGHVGG